MLRVNYENHKDLVFHGIKSLLYSPALKDCLVVCSDGEKEVNSLVMGLLFPVLQTCEVFHFPVNQTIVLQKVKVAELESMVKEFDISLETVDPALVKNENVEDVQEAIQFDEESNQINQELVHIFGAEILSTLDNSNLGSLPDNHNPPLEVSVEDNEFKDSPCPFESCGKKFYFDKLLKLHIENTHSFPEPVTPSPNKASSLTASPTSSPLKFYTPVKQIIPVQTLFKCDLPGCAKTFQKQQTFLKHKGTHKLKLDFKMKENSIGNRRIIQGPKVAMQSVYKESVIVAEDNLNVDQFYQANDILGEQFAYKNDKQKFKCLFDKCRIEFQFRHELRSHYIDHEVQDFVCPECDLRFDVKSNLNEHRFKAHHILAVNKDICPFCDAVFFSKETFRNHMLVKHRGPWQCESCHEMIYTLNEFKQHRLDHTESNLTCDWPKCYEVFSDRAQLKIHLSNHETEEFYTCPNYLCNFFFCTLQGFEKHLKMHESEDSFDCTKCNKKYYNMRQFECHIEAGHMQNPKAYEFASEVNLECPEDNCNRSFVQEKWLLKHLKTHVLGENSCNQIKPRRARNGQFKETKIQKTEVDHVTSSN